MPALSIKKAKDGKHITDKEIERFACMFMICQDQIKPSGKLFEQAAVEHGGTKGSFEFAYRTAIKKLKENNCYVDDAATPNATTSKGASKRKSTADGEEISNKARVSKKNGGDKVKVKQIDGEVSI